MTGPVTGPIGDPDLVPVADHGVLVRFGDDIDPAVHARVLDLADALRRRPPAGLVEIVPAMTSVLVEFDPTVTDHDAIAASVRSDLADPAHRPPGAAHVVDVCHDEPFAPDLVDLARLRGLEPDEVVAAHLGATYTVGMYGFAPGFAYLYGTPGSIRQPRRATPGPVVPAGSVIVAGQQCLVIPVVMSTGWFAIGRSPTRMFDPDAERPFLVDVGDTVTFRRITADELHDRLGAHGPSR